jgi:hypothetical protein
MNAAERIKKEYLKNNNITVHEIGYMDTFAMFESWLEKNSMPTVDDLESYDQALNKSVWALRYENARCIFNNMIFYENMESGIKNIKDAIGGRSPQETMLTAGLNYVEKLTDINQSKTAMD